ncbi:Rap1a/Tai family immunity protein [Kosakonia sp. H02]|nr:Rap1a/Tai family immunity protein [Kosakonia sp. H02]
MKMRIVIAGSLLVLSALASAETTTYQYPQANPLPEDSTTNLLRDPALLNGFDVNMSAQRFADAWFSKTNERERIKADMYLLGVLDTTEGTIWCGYNRLLPSSIHENLYSYFENLGTEKGKQRASKTITDAMSELMPCKKENKK